MSLHLRSQGSKWICRYGIVFSRCIGENHSAKMAETVLLLLPLQFISIAKPDEFIQEISFHINFHFTLWQWHTCPFLASYRQFMFELKIIFQVQGKETRMTLTLEVNWCIQDIQTVILKMIIFYKWHFDVFYIQTSITSTFLPDSRRLFRRPNIDVLHNSVRAVNIYKILNYNIGNMRHNVSRHALRPFYP